MVKQEANKEEDKENAPVGLSQLIGQLRQLIGDDPLLIVLAVATLIIIILLLTDFMLDYSLIGRPVERLLGGR